MASPHPLHEGTWIIREGGLCSLVENVPVDKTVPHSLHAALLKFILVLFNGDQGLYRTRVPCTLFTRRC